MKGLTLIEILIVLVIIGIIALLMTVDTSWLMRETRVSEARDRLLADIEDVKLKSIAQVPHAVVISSATSYKKVSLNDTNGNFMKDTSGIPETSTDIPNSTVTLPLNVRVSWNNGSELWFDRKGIPRTANWGYGSGTFVVWYDVNGDGNPDFTDGRGNGASNGNVDHEDECDEPCKLIIIDTAGRIQYEKR